LSPYFQGSLKPSEGPDDGELRLARKAAVGEAEAGA
jgi:hypothetical protein